MKKVFASILVATAALNCYAQWNGNAAENNRMGLPGKDYYDQQTVTNKEGVSYLITVQPNGQNEHQQSQLAHRLQVIDKDGKKLKEDGGELFSNYGNRSYMVVNETAVLTKEGNLIYVVHDARNSDPSLTYLGYSLYQFDPTGKEVWDEPWQVWNGEVFAGSAGFTMAPTDDGGLIVAFFTFSMVSEEPSKLRIEKFSAEGKSLWQRTLEDSKIPYSYPYLRDAGDNQTILVYAKGSQQFLMAKMLDFDGSDVWAKDAVIYQGGFDQIPLWTHLQVNSAPEGGVYVSWRDERDLSGSFSNYISSIKNDGSYGFPDGANALKISYADNFSRMAPKIAVDKKNKCIYAVYNQFYQAEQSKKGIFMQKIGLDGELMWDPEGVAVVDIQGERQVGYASVKLAEDGHIAVFWMDNANNGFDAHCYCQKYDKEGTALWKEPLNFATTASEKSTLEVSDLIDGKYWIANWKDNRDNVATIAMMTTYMQRVNIDGSLGDPTTGIEDTRLDQTADGTTTLYNLNGQRVNSAKGLVIEKRGERVRKIIIRQ